MFHDFRLTIETLKVLSRQLSGFRTRYSFPPGLAVEDPRSPIGNEWGGVWKWK